MPSPLSGYCTVPVHVYLNDAQIWYGNLHFPYASEDLLQTGSFSLGSTVSTVKLTLADYATDYARANAVLPKSLSGAAVSLIGDTFTPISVSAGGAYGDRVTVRMDGTELYYSYTLSNDPDFFLADSEGWYGSAKTQSGATVFMPKFWVREISGITDPLFKTPFIVGGLKNGKVENISVFSFRNSDYATRRKEFYLNYNASVKTVYQNTIEFLNLCRLNGNAPPVDITQRDISTQGKSDSFTRGFLTGQRLKLSHLDRNLAAPIAPSVGHTGKASEGYDRQSFLSGLAAGMTSEGWPNFTAESE